MSQLPGCKPAFSALDFAEVSQSPTCSHTGTLSMDDYQIIWLIDVRDVLSSHIADLKPELWCYYFEWIEKGTSSHKHNK